MATTQYLFDGPPQSLPGWVHCPGGWLAPYALPVLVAVLMALTAVLIARSISELRYPVPIGDFQEVNRAEAEWLVMGTVTSAYGCRWRCTRGIRSSTSISAARR
jgi:hypothetical protein